MLACFIWLLVATVFVQVPNLLGIQNQQHEGILTFYDALKIAAITLPLTFIATTGFTLYYGRAEQYFSYPAMVVYAHIGALFVGILIQVFILKAKDTNPLELIGLGVCITGLLISIFSKDIMKYFSA
jgi:hypothetical protein